VEKSQWISLSYWHSYHCIYFHESSACMCRLRIQHFISPSTYSECSLDMSCTQPSQDLPWHHYLSTLGGTLYSMAWSGATSCEDPVVPPASEQLSSTLCGIILVWINIVLAVKERALALFTAWGSVDDSAILLHHESSCPGGGLHILVMWNEYRL
jgi:hypothetical protein